MKKTPKSVTIPVSQREAFALWMHLRSAAVSGAREQDSHDDLWTAFGLDEIDARVLELADGATFAAFSEEELSDVELSREEIAALVNFTTRPMTGQLVRYLMLLRKRWEAARDKEGLKAVPAPPDDAA